MNTTRRNFIARFTAKLALPIATVVAGVIGGAPANAQAYCAKQNRECLVFISDLTSTNQTYAQKKFYQFVEFSAKAVAVGTLKYRYNKVHVCSGTGAKRAKLPAMLKYIAGRSSVRAVDLIFVTHGLSGEVVFSDQKVSMSTVRWDIRNKISSSLRKKFRMVFSTACYGSSHRWYWRNAGFECVSGGRRIYADSGTSYVAFLASWAAGGSFQHAVNVANASDPLKLQDNAAKSLLWSWGHSKWKDVDSHRNTYGRTHLRITHRPY